MPSILSACLLVAALLMSDGDVVDDMIQEFQRFYRGNASVAEKIEAIHVLDGADRPSAVAALAACFGDEDFTVRQTAIDVIGKYRDPACAQWLLDEIVTNRRERSGLRRITAVEVLGRMRSEAAVAPIVELMQKEKDEDLTRAACRALGAIGSTAATPALLPLLEHSEPTVRIAALDALGTLEDPAANPAVLAQLGDGRWQVRAAAIGALGKIRLKESVQPLIDRLRLEDGRLREDLAAALLSITTFDFGHDADKWQTNWDRVKERFVVPTKAEVAKTREAAKKSQLRYKPATDDFAGIPTKSRRIVYVVDISGSMEEPLLDRERFVLEGRTYSDFVKMSVVKHELVRTIENLDDTVLFNVYAFASEVDTWNRRGLVQANVMNRKKAAEWVSKLKPIGGASQALKGRAGLALAASQDKGKTNFYDALMAALDAKAGQAAYDTDLGAPADTIYFLSDGDPTAGPITEIDRILEEVRRVNALKKIVIHTINIGRNERGKVLMKALADQNGGTFIDLGE